MAAQTHTLQRTLHHLRTASAAPAGDGQLLDRFARLRDESAFAELLRRHGRLVLGVARRQLADRHAAEDVFQATFLALARSAARLGQSGPLAGWLYTVAYRLARKERARAARRPGALPEDPPSSSSADALAQLSGRELVRILDDELARLPERYRLPLLLCGVEGLARDEAAARLGWSLGALRGRLERARELLRQRLARRGLEAPALLGFLTADSASAVPPALADTVTRAALAVPLASGLRPLLSLTAAVLLVVVGLGAALAARPDEPPTPAPAPAAKQPAPQQQPAKPAPRVDRYGDPLPEGALARIGTNRLVLYGNIVTFSPDGRLIAGGGENEDVVRVWETKDGKPVAVLKPALGRTSITELAFSPDGKLLVVGGFWADKLRVWDVAAEKLLHALPNAAEGQDRWARRGQGSTFFFINEGKTLLVAGKDGALHYWEAATGRQLAHVPAVKEKILNLMLTANGATALTAHARGELHLWDVKARRHLRKLDVPPLAKMDPPLVKGDDGVIPHLTALAPDGATFACCHRERLVEVRQTDTGKVLHKIASDEVVVGLSYAPDGVLRVAGNGGEVAIWDMQTGKKTAGIDCKGPRKWDESPNWITRAWFSPDGRKVAWMASSAIRFWDLKTGQEQAPLSGHRKGVTWTQFSADGRRLMTAGYGTEFGVWDAATGREERPLRSLALGEQVWYRLSADRRRMLILDGGERGESGRILLWDPTADRPPAPLAGQVKPVQDATLSHDNRFVVASEGGRIVVYDADKGKLVRAFAGKDLGGHGYERYLTLSPDGAVLATTVNQARANAIRVYDFTSGKLLHDVNTGHPIHQLAMSPGGQLLASHGHGFGEFDRVPTRGDLVTVWHVGGGRKLIEIPTGHSQVSSLAFSPDGRLILTGGWEGELRLWEVATGQERRRYAGHHRDAGAVDFSPDGLRIASGSYDCTALVWRVFDPASVELTDAELTAKWADLAKDGDAAHRAVGAFISAKGGAAFLAKRLVPAAAPSEEVTKLVAALDHPRFAAREKAEKELARLGDAAAPALRRALAGKPTEELRQRADKLLRALTVPVTNAELLRSLRAVEALEHIRTSAARAHLRALADGAAGSELTRAAAAALKRLK